MASTFGSNILYNITDDLESIWSWIMEERSNSYLNSGFLERETKSTQPKMLHTQAMEWGANDLKR